MEPALLIIIDQIRKIPLPLLVQKAGKTGKRIQRNEQQLFLPGQKLAIARANDVFPHLPTGEYTPMIRFPEAGSPGKSVFPSGVSQ